MLLSPLHLPTGRKEWYLLEFDTYKWMFIMTTILTKPLRLTENGVISRIILID